jgi:mRNA interferase MazF
MKKNNLPIVKRGEIWYADMSPVIGSEQGGLRPVIIVQNDVGNKFAPTTIAVPLTSRLTKKPLPTHAIFTTTCLRAESVALCEQVRTLDKMRMKTLMGSLDAETMTKIDKALAISLGLG